MKLFGSYTSPYVRHCRIAFMEEKIPFEMIDTDFVTSGVSSPCKRVPYLEDGDLFLSDSSAILHYIRQKAGSAFLPTPQDTNLFSLANTALDTAINVFLLEKGGVTPETCDYVGRQQARIASSFAALDEASPSFTDRPGDAVWRVACLLDWANFRERYDFSGHPNLVTLLEQVSTIEDFRKTAPPRN